MTDRQRLPNRRASETFSFRWLSMNFTATVSRFDSGDLAEIFLENHQAGTHADTTAKDSAVVASLALQHGVPVNTLRKALLRDPRGVAGGPLGVALDLVVLMDGAGQGGAS